ncbi:neuronal acetylcholine receptor subunit alpha-7-like isoform X2 [Amphiura filiformis]|uniref:neuronal acetylcholine receptor subunit alpha-7-like isoform X2 n=1 Tax=Amphiura filiformis TaxID=82378 RepID=UPI003B211419
MISRNGGPGKFAFLTGCILLLFPRDTRPGSMERELLDYLLDKKKFPQRDLALPTDPGGNAVVVKLGLTLNQLMDVNEKSQIVTTNAWMQVEWKDMSLVWNDTIYKAIPAVRIPPTRIWHPDILMYNSADDRFDATFHANIVVYSNGDCLWVPPGLLKSTCTIDVAYFPFDEQSCEIKFSSWTYDGNSLDLQPGDNNTDAFQENGEWELLGMPVARHEEYYYGDPYPDVTFYMKLRRRSLYYSINILIPCVLLSALTLLGFTLPPDSGEKLSFDVTILLSLTVFMMIVAEAMPETSMAVPLISKYFTCTMIMVAASVVLTIFTLNLHHRHPKFTPPMPNWVRLVILEWMAWLLRMERPGKDTSSKGDKSKDPKRREIELLERSPLRGKSQTQSYFPGNGIRTDPRNFYNSQDLIGIKYASYAEDEHDPMVIDQQIRQRKDGGRLVSSECATILEELRFISERFREQDEEDDVVNDWKFAAMVIDRACLVFFTVFTAASTIGILASAPNLGKDLKQMYGG